MIRNAGRNWGITSRSDLAAVLFVTLTATALSLAAGTPGVFLEWLTWAAVALGALGWFLRGRVRS